MKIYLAGPIFGRSDADCGDWRERAKRLLAPEFETLDPMVRDYRGREDEPGITAKIVEGDKADIDECHAVLVWFDKPSVGTAMEVLYAWTPRWPRRAASNGPTRLPVFVVNVTGGPVSPWLRHHSRDVTDTLEEACEAIRRRFL